MDKTVRKSAVKMRNRPADGVANQNAQKLIDLVPEYDEIGGWLKLDEAELLFQAGATVKSGAIVEIGSYRGRSTVALAAGSRRGSKTPVFAIEPHELFIGPKGGAYGPKDRRFFLQTLLKTKLYGMVRLVNTTSDVVSPGWDKRIALLFIDGDQRFDAVRSDFDNWRPFLMDSATVIFNGAKNPGPMECIDELVEEGCLSRVSSQGHLAILRFHGVATGIEPESVVHVATPGIYPRLIVHSSAGEAKQNLNAIGRGVYFGGNGSYLYQPIPKCGCTSIKTILLELENLPVSPDEWTRHNKEHNQFPGTDTLTAAHQQAIFEGRTDTFKFVIARDPYTRMASVYADKIVGGYEKGSRYWINLIKRTAADLGISLSDEITFEEFVQVACAQAIKDMDPHWRHQYHVGHLGTIKFDFVGHLEMLTPDLLYVLERLRAPQSLMQKAARPHNVTGSGIGMWSQVSAETRRKFTKTYEIDFDTLHYPSRRGYSW